MLDNRDLNLVKSQGVAVFVFCISMLCLVSMNPFYVWGMYQYSFVFFLFLSCLFYCYSFRPCRVDSSLMFGSCSVFICVLLYFYLMGASFFGAVAFALSSFLLYVLTREEVIVVFLYFKKVFSFFLLPGIFIWCVHLLLGDSTLFQIGRVADDLVPAQVKVELGQGYYKYPFMVVLDYMLDMPIYRFMGPFDEPGVVGTITALLLIADRFNYVRKENWIILFAGIISFSLAFYLLVSLYVLIFFARKPRALLPVIFLASIFIVFLSCNEFTNKIILDRLDISESGMSGNNRVDDRLKLDYEAWVDGELSEIFFGLNTQVDTGSSSWKQIPVKAGLLGLFVCTSILFMFVFKFSTCFNYNLFLFLFLFLLSFAQRPDVVKPEYILIFAAGLAKCAERPQIRFVDNVRYS